MTDDPTPSEQNNPTSDDMRLAEEWANSGRTVGALPRRQRPQRPTPRTTSQPPVSSPDTPAPKNPRRPPPASLAVNGSTSPSTLCPNSMSGCAPDRRRRG